VVRSRRQRGQSIVEFGIIAILFTLIMFAIADFGLLLNDWLAVSSGARHLARDAAVGMYTCTTVASCPAGKGPDLANEAGKLSMPGVSADASFTGGYCCSPTSALQLNVTYYDQCTPNVGSCAPVSDLSKLDSRYSSNGAQGTCTAWQLAPPNNVCDHPSPPRAVGGCSSGPGNPCPGDTIVVTLTAAGAQVITPLVRPFFDSPTCRGNMAHCYVGLSSSVTMRFEGDTL
jgi:hypothetical protein